MFDVNGLGIKVTFQKGQSFHPRFNEPRFCILCSIQRTHGEIIGHAELAFLNPVDRNDKVIGKKVALQKTMEAMHFDKFQRTLTWKAFWAYINSWKKENVK